MKRLLLLLSLIGVMLLAACGTTDNTSNEEDSSNETETEEVAEEEAEESEETETSSEQVEEVIYDENNIVITYLGLEKEEDAIFGDRVKIKFDVENNTDRNIVIQSEELSTDGRMVNDSFVTMSDEVAAGKVGTATLDIMALGDDELPSMEENVELTLRVFDWDDFEFGLKVPVSIDLK